MTQTNTPGTALAINPKTQAAIDQIRSDEITVGIREALPEGVSLQQFQRAASTALLKDSNLVNADRKSLIMSLIRAAQDGLMPDGRESALVIFKGSAQYIPMISGLRKIAAEHGISLMAHVVYENDQFDPDLDTGRANHKPARLGSEPGPVIGAYAVAQDRQGRRFLEVMNVDQINDVRNKASRAKDGEAWTKWWDAMAEKTVARRLWKKLPFDPKERERLMSIDSDVELDAAEALFGVASIPENVDPVTGEVHEPIPDAADDKNGNGAEDGEWEDVPDFEGDEPPLVEEREAASFTTGRYAGKTVAEVWDEGEDGRRYVKWAVKNWKTGPVVAALAAFAAEHEQELA